MSESEQCSSISSSTEVFNFSQEKMESLDTVKEFPETAIDI